MKKLIIMSIIVGGMFTSAIQAQDSNPFFQKWAAPYEAPPFEKITAEHYAEAYKKGMEEQAKEIVAIASSKNKATFENTIVAYDQSGKLLRSVSMVFGGIVSAQTSPEMQKLQMDLSPVLSIHRDEILMNPELFKRIDFVYKNTKRTDVSPEDYRLLYNVYQDFVRGGANLSVTDKEKFKKINEEISKLQTLFGQNLLVETAAFKLVIDNEKDLAGLPEDLVTAAAIRGEKDGVKGKWVFGLDNPSIMPFLEFADNRDLREKIFTAYLNRCNNGNSADNKDVIDKLINLRIEKAKMLGFATFADYALDDRMAKKPSAVYELLDQLWSPALNMAKQEAADMQANIGNAFTLGSWDWRYYSNKIRQLKYSLSEEMISPYFQSDNVREGIFWVCNQLYGISFKELDNISKPHPDAKAFLCIDADGKTELGILYIDLFARPGFKRGGAWCGSYRTQGYENGKRTLPITTIVCNFTAPIGDKPALLTSDETETFFHEFGHALHNLFKDVHYNATAGVPRDFVELPSQIMEHWAFQPQVLEHYAKHYQTGEVIPKELVDKIVASSKFGQGFATTEYLAASYLDMDYHMLTAPKKIDVLKFEADALSSRGLIPQIPPRYRSTYFQHTMTGGYTAGYYSYIWSEVLDCDGFKAFEETGNIFDKATAAKFRKFILAPGCIDDPMDMYVNFRGSKPKIDALLENRGLK